MNSNESLFPLFEIFLYILDTGFYEISTQKKILNKKFLFSNLYKVNLKSFYINFVLHSLLLRRFSPDKSFIIAPTVHSLVDVLKTVFSIFNLPRYSRYD